MCISSDTSPDRSVQRLAPASTYTRRLRAARMIPFATGFLGARARRRRGKAGRAELTRADATRALDALDEIVLAELGNAHKVRIGGLVQLTVRVKPAQKK